MFWRSVFDLLGFPGGSISSSSAPDMPVVNPATGMPMLGDSTGGVDVGGSPFGIDSHQSTMGSFNSMEANPWD